MNLTIPAYDLDYSKKITGHDLAVAHQKAADKFNYAHLKSRIPGRENEVLSIVEYKFMLYRYCLKNDLFKKPVPDKFKTISEYRVAFQTWQDAFLLFNDYSIYSFANLKWNAKPIMLYPFQDVIINDTHKRIDIESANQCGKSFVLCVKAAINYLKDHEKNYVIGLISKSQNQNSSNMRMIKLLLSTANLAYDAGVNDNMTVTTRNIMQTYIEKDEVKVTDKVSHTNTLVCAVASTSALGFPFNDIFLDEFEFWENPEGLEYMYDQIMDPRTFHTKGNIMIFSNPNGKNFVSENLQKRKQNDGTNLFHVYNFNFMDKPGNTPVEWNEKKSQMHPIIFASTMAAERTEAMGAFFTDAEIRDSYDARLTEQGDYAGMDKQCYFFLDVGAVHDQSVLTGLYTELTESGEEVFKVFMTHYYPVTYPLWRVVGVSPGKDTTLNANDGWDPVVKDNPTVKDIMLKYTFPQKLDIHGKKIRDEIQPMLGVDVTGHAAIIPLCQAAGISPKDVTFSGPIKWKMYERFKTLMAKRLVRRIKKDNWINNRNQDFEYQCRKLIIKTGNRYNLIHHEQEDDLDDVTDSVAGCISMADSGMVPNISAEYVEGSTLLDEKPDPDFQKEIENQRRQEMTFNY